MPEILPETYTRKPDLLIAGGGLAGLSLGIQVARAGFRVVLAEKEAYPFHRVCGEYISMESWDFLEQLGVPLTHMQLPKIRHLTVTAPNGVALEHSLPLGGFGVSRFTLDMLMAGIAREAGVEVLEKTKVKDIHFTDGSSAKLPDTYKRNRTPGQGSFDIQTSAGDFQSRAVAGTFGKRSNLDIRWRRSFAMEKAGPLVNYIGVKYHISGDYPKDRIYLHNFPDGYCGMSAVEGDEYCLCYLTTAENLRNSGQQIPQMESTILAKNPRLRELFSSARFLWPEPVAISQISFAHKELIRQHVLFCGDAAGMITPLCGNGMSMALHGSKLLATELIRFLEGGQDRIAFEKNYRKQWEKTFSARLRTGRWIQSLFGKSTATNLFIGAMKPFPSLVDHLIRQTHGRPF
jgi:flavin-dependent dehydrogenase